MELYESVDKLSGISDKRKEKYAKLGVETIYDLLRYFPRKYLDYSEQTAIENCILGEVNTIKAVVVKKFPVARIRQGLILYKMTVADDSGEITVIFYNNKYTFEQIKLSEEYIFCGRVNDGFKSLTMNTPAFIEAHDKIQIQPVYSLTEGLTTKMITTNVKAALSLASEIPEIIPFELRAKYNLVDIDYAYSNIHFPENENGLASAKRRLFFDEMLSITIGMKLIKSYNKTEIGCEFTENPDVISEFIESLPFELTSAQLRATNEILSDMCGEFPMNRLIQGDVGSGKTVVAAAAAFYAAKNGFQTALMAPTEILATQHFTTFSKLLENTGIKCCLVVGGLTPKQRREVNAKIADGFYNVIIGTHALISESTEFKSLALVIMDEQHRFGVNQRAKLASKGKNPHKLVMSATPIPRTLALIIYGDLDISIINELPKGRQKIETFAVTSKLRSRAFSFVKEQLNLGRQGYIICPMIEDNDGDLVAVNSYAEMLLKGDFAGYNIGVLHGKMSALQKNEVMNEFLQGKIQLLVSTTVVEVGVDVPNATIILIENAEQFGLSQLHQLRGRVGRGEHKSYCVLVAGKVSDENKKRLKIMTETTDGFKISEFDLNLRGAGDFFGSRQHGLPKNSASFLVADNRQIIEVQDLAEEILSDKRGLKAYPKLKESIDKMFDTGEATAL